MSPKRYKISKIYISELGFLMIRIYIKEESRWTNINLGKWEDVFSSLQEAGFDLKDIDY